MYKKPLSLDLNRALCHNYKLEYMVGKMVLSLTLFAILLTTTYALPDTHDELIITDQSHLLHNSIINPVIYTGGYALLYLDKYGVIWARKDSGKGPWDLWAFNGTWNKMYTFEGPIYSAYRTANNVLLVSIRYDANTSGALMRSIDNATTFSTVLTYVNGTYQAPWSYGSLGSKIVVGQYGVKSVTGETKNVWLSVDDGLTWNTIYKTNPSQDRSHIHAVGIDNKGVIYVTHGDTYKDAIRSSDDGATWTNFGMTDQYTSMAFSNNFMLFGNDPLPQFVAINDVSSRILANLPAPWTNFIGKIDYVNGVFYAIQCEENLYPNKTGLWISTNGRDWYLIYDITGLRGDFAELEHDEKNLVWGAMNNFSVMWQNPLLTIDEANELIYGNLQNRTVAHDPQYYSFYTRPLTNASITIYGQTARNLVSNPSFENNFTGWSSTLNTSSDIYTVDNMKFHSGRKSAHVATNGPGYRGKIYQTVFNNNITTLPANTTVTWSGWIKLNSTANNSFPTATYNPAIIIGSIIKYQDGTTSDTAMYDREARALISTGGQWVRFSETKKFQKPIQQIKLCVNFYQNLEAWIDDVQIQIGDLTPYIDGSANTSGSLTINGELITIPELGSKKSITIGLKNDLNNFVTIFPNLTGNQIATIGISGARILNSTNALVNFSEGMYHPSKTYTNPIIELYKPVNIEHSPIVRYNISDRPTVVVTTQQSSSWMSCCVGWNDYLVLVIIAIAIIGDTIYYIMRNKIKVNNKGRIK